MRGMREKTFESVVAVITEVNPYPSHFYDEVKIGAEERCRELGYVPTEFPTAFDRKSLRQLNRVLNARNIEGVLLLSRNPEDMSPPVLDMKRLSVVNTTTFNAPFPVHEVIPDHHFNIELIYKELEALGCRRPGLISWSDLNQRQHQAAPMVHYQYAHDVFQQAPTLPFHWAGTEQEIESSFERWFKQTKPDSLVFPDANIPTAINDILGGSILEELPCFGFAMPGPGFVGVDQRPRVIGRSAIDLLTSHMQRYDRGWPEVTKHVLIPGELKGPM